MKGVDFYTIILIAPVFSTLFILIVMGLDLYEHGAAPKYTSKVKLLCFLVSLSLNILLPLFYFYTPSVFVYLNWLLYLSIFITPVIFYHFIIEITSTLDNEHFAWQHYIIPIGIGMMQFILLFTTPYQEQLQAITSRAQFTDGYSIFSIVNNSKIPIRLILITTYTTFCFMRLHQYRKFIINKSLDEHSPLRWVNAYLFSLIILFAVSLFATLIPHHLLLSVPLISSSCIIVIFLQIYMCYHMIQGNFICQEQIIRDGKTQISEHLPEKPLKKSVLSKAFFEAYINSQKPYLNHNLRISDMVHDLEVNRTYISSFINREYGMNFSCYINQCRLSEYYKLRSDALMKDKDNRGLSELAGYSSYRYFLKQLQKSEYHG